MKSTILHSLTAAVAFFGLCATVEAACATGGKNSNYPSPYGTANTGAVGPVTSNLASPFTPSAPQARLTVVPTADAPAGRLQVAPAIEANSTAKAAIRDVPAAEIAEPAPATDEDLADITPATEEELADITPKDEADLATTLASIDGSGDGSASKIAESLKGLVGTWLAVSREGDGELSTVELKLDDNGWATLKVPGADGKSSTTTRKVEFDNNELKLTGGDADVILGKLVEFDSRQLVLERSGGQVTFVRP